MQINTIKKTKTPKPKRVGRGGKKGTYSGGGMKGQKVRAGYSKRATFEGGRTSLSAKTKKVRGFKSSKEGFQVVGLEMIERKFSAGEEVTPQSLKEKKVVNKSYVPIKILSADRFSKKLVFSGLAFSKKAEEMVKKAGGKIG